MRGNGALGSPCFEALVEVQGSTKNEAFFERGAEFVHENLLLGPENGLLSLLGV